MKYDTWDRMVLNAEPNTSVGFTDSPAMDPSGLMAWRYVYDDAGELVGTSDARGCGVNYAYDPAGRLLSEDYSPCAIEQAPYNADAEVSYRYDSRDTASDPPPSTLALDAQFLRGRLVSVTSRAAHDVTAYDGRGRAVGSARQLRVGDAFEDTWYAKHIAYDDADRPVDESTGLPATSALVGDSGDSIIHTEYARSGAVRAVGGSYGTLVSGLKHDADGKTLKVVYGDIAQTATQFSYDQRRRVKTVQTDRGPPSAWTSPPTGYVPDAANQALLLEDTDFEYDRSDNPMTIRDYRVPGEWPAGAKPRTRRQEYDDLNRVTKITYGNVNDAGEAWTSPDDVTGAMPHQVFDHRTQWESVIYDWQGNGYSADDDAHGFWDRSLGFSRPSGRRTGPISWCMRRRRRRRRASSARTTTRRATWTGSSCAGPGAACRRGRARRRSPTAGTRSGAS